MAEVAAVIGLVASITSLVEISSKVVSRLREFAVQTPHIPETFHALSILLPLLTKTLESIRVQAESGTLPEDTIRHVRDVVENTCEHVSRIQACLSAIVPTKDASKLERTRKALKSLAKEDKILQTLTIIQRNNDILVLYQTTRHVDTGELILAELSKLQINPPAKSWSRGVHLSQAPRIAPDAFIGREPELEQVKKLLLSRFHPSRERIVSIVGMGGMGKTQLALAHVRQCAQEYSSVFWFDASGEARLRQSMAAIGVMVVHGSVSSVTRSADEDKLQIDNFRHWLSEPGNDQWLAIFDNYDDPCLQGARSPTGFDVQKFFPFTSQGSILLTSRSAKLTFSQQIRLQKLQDPGVSISILSQRSGRDFTTDKDASALAERLSGLPLALATAGSFLRSAPDISCGEYLTLYESTWADLVGTDVEERLVFESRPMESTWSISLQQVSNENEDAASLLRFFAYLGSHDIWYDLIHAAASDEVPWLRRVTESKLHFRRAMSKLYDYSLVDIVGNSFQLHPCLHDWLVASFTKSPERLLFIAALTSIAYKVHQDSTPNFWIANRRLFEHVRQLESPRFDGLWQLCMSEERVQTATDDIVGLLREWEQLEKAELMCTRVLVGKEKVLGPDHVSTLETAFNLGRLYRDQSEFSMAEQAFKRALSGNERARGNDHISTLNTIHCLGALYHDQGKVDLAEESYLRALAGKEKILGLEHPLTLVTVNNLGRTYRSQGKLDAAEQMYLRALAGNQKALGSEHTWTLTNIHNLGALYRDQGNFHASEEMYDRALAGKKKTLGPNHTWTLSTTHNLGHLYRDQGKDQAAEEMFSEALRGFEALLGPLDPLTREAALSLSILYQDQGKVEKAKKMAERAQKKT
ncbi:hypothetical protein LTS17_012413 [Exophiala oligosperma]